MAQTGLILVPLLLLSIVILVQSRSPEICNSKSEVKLLASNKRPPERSEFSRTNVIKDVPRSEPERKKKCRANCKEICLKYRGGCVAFASMVSTKNPAVCLCWGYKNLPDFGRNVPIERAKYLNGWCVAEWFSFGMPL